MAANNNSVELNSTNESDGDESEDEPIDVVKSAFVPPLPRPLSCNSSSPSPTRRCDLKAPSVKKPQHESAAPRSVKIKQEAPKTVWRPY